MNGRERAACCNVTAKNWRADSYLRRVKCTHRVARLVAITSPKRTGSAAGIDVRWKKTDRDRRCRTLAKITPYAGEWANDGH